MKNSTKGMLLSGLVYPGVGQLILGSFTSGIVLVLLATAGMVVMVYRILERLSRLVDQILPMLADNRLNMATLKEILDRDPAGGWGVENVCLIGIVGSWLVAIVHAYFVGKKIDQRTH